MKLIKWIGKTFESHGEPSSKRTTLFAITVLYLVINIVYTQNISDKDWRFYQLLLNATVILLILGVVTIQSIIELWKNIKGTVTTTTKTDTDLTTDTLKTTTETVTKKEDVGNTNNNSGDSQ